MANATPKRKHIGKKSRFEVFKRDKFKCQYCGKSSPEVVLHVDHITPVSKGGTNDILNLITSCACCNLGKSDRLLDDSTEIQKQKRELELLSERREQLEMMIEWRESLRSVDNDYAQAVKEQMDLVVGRSLNVSDNGMNTIRKWVKEYSFPELCDAIEASADSYLKHEDDGSVSEISLEKFFKYIPRIAKIQRREGKSGITKNTNYCIGILRNRFEWFNYDYAYELISECFEHGAYMDEVKKVCCSERSWSACRNELQQLSKELQEV